MYKRNEQKKKKRCKENIFWPEWNNKARKRERECRPRTQLWGLTGGRLKDRQKSKSRCSKREKLSSIYKRSTAASDAGLTVRAPGEYVLKYSLKDLCAFFFLTKKNMWCEFCCLWILYLFWSWERSSGRLCCTTRHLSSICVLVLFPIADWFSVLVLKFDYDNIGRTITELSMIRINVAAAWLSREGDRWW